MTLIIMILRKMAKNAWIMGSFFIGLLISVALISSIPVYTDGILQRMIVKELEESQKATNIYPSRLLTRAVYNNEWSSEQKREKFEEMDDYMNKNVPRMIGIPHLAKVQSISLDNMRLERKDPAQRRTDKKIYAKIQAISDMKNHITITDGRMASDKIVDGAIEAIVPEIALNKLSMVLDTPFILTDETDKNAKPITIIPVGTFTVKDERDLYWFYAPDTYAESFLIDYDLFNKTYVESEPALFKVSSWYYAFDYNEINVNNINQVMWAQDQVKRKVASVFTNYYSDAPSQQILMGLAGEEKKLRTVLWALYVPIIIMLGFYILMVSRLIVDRQRNEIAVLRSRGASRMQILTDYFIEGLLIGGLAFIVGPWIALSLGKILGASNGFLEFVQRKSIKIQLNEVAYMYAALAVGASMITMIIPAFIATGTSIVGHKQKLARGMGMTVWEKFFIDILLLAVSVYGLYTFKGRQASLAATGADAASVQVDPLLFFIPALCALGGGLLFLRIYPWILRLIYWLGRKVWTPPLYSILIQVGRSSRQYQFIMLFLIMSISTGLFGANAARTINENAQERINYMTGADVTVAAYWENNAEEVAREIENATAAAAEVKANGETQMAGPPRVQYKEPPFTIYTDMKDVAHAAKVFRKAGGTMEAGGQSYSDVEIMGVNSYDFGQTVWFRGGLLPHHINEYLNLLADEPSAILISRSLSQKAGLKTGDYIQLGWGSTDNVGYTVYGIIDYWPGWNPNRDPKAPPEEVPLLVVGNLEYMQDHNGLEPYEVWLKLKPNATSAELYQTLVDKNVSIAELNDARQEIIKIKTAPNRLAINGGLTLGFIISMLICLIGFLLYWILSLSGRTLQFGILRAMGISRMQLFSMIGIEQLLTSGIAIVIGVIMGNVTSKFYVPLFQVTSNAAEQVPPFRVISNLGDLIKIYGWVIAMLVLGLGILGYLASRIKIASAVKLGED